MESNFQKSWSVYGYRKFDSQHNEHFAHGRPIFASGRTTRTNLQQRFHYSPDPKVIHRPIHHNEDLNPQNYASFSDERDCPFYIKPNNGLGFRSLTDSNMRRFEVNGVTRSCNELDSPKNSLRLPLRQLPERIGPIWNNIQNSVTEVGPRTERFFQKGGERVQKAFRGVRTSFHSFSQRFKKTTRRRYQLDNTPTRTPTRTPRSDRVTPGKLYSPFDVNTPRTPHSYTRGPKRLQNGPARRRVFGNENLGLCRTPPHHHHFHSHSQIGPFSRSSNWINFGASPSYSNRPLPYPNPNTSYGPFGAAPQRPEPQYENVPYRN